MSVACTGLRVLGNTVNRCTPASALRPGRSLHAMTMMMTSSRSRRSTAIALGLLLSSSGVAAEGRQQQGEGNEIIVKVYEGPKSCTNSDDPNELPNQIVNEYVVGLHFTVTIDDSSKAGERGAKIESSHDRGIAPSFPVGKGKVIPGLDQGLVGLCKGSKAHIIIPPHLAYGDIGVPSSNVPGGVTLRYDVEILDIKEPAQNDFALIDANDDGKISKEEAKQYFESKGQMIDLEALFKAEDKDVNGFVEWEEFSGPKGDGPPDSVLREQKRRMQEEQAAQARAQAQAQAQQQQQQQQQQEEAAQTNDPQQQVAELFQQFDANGDMKISKEELAAAFVAMGSEMTDEFWTESDKNEDGYVDFEEFVGEQKKEGGDEL